jgi:hypothetical protein
VLGAPGPMPSQTLIEQFNEALCAVAFDKGNIARQQSAVRAAHAALLLHHQPGRVSAVVSGCSLPCAVQKSKRCWCSAPHLDDLRGGSFRVFAAASAYSGTAATCLMHWPSC